MILSMKDWGIIMDIMVVINQMIQLFLIIGLGYFMQKKKILNVCGLTGHQFCFS